MTTQTIRTQGGFLDTRAAAAPSTRRSGTVRAFLREAGETLRGAFEAPFRQAFRTGADPALAPLDPATRRDIGL